LISNSNFAVCPRTANSGSIVCLIIISSHAPAVTTRPIWRRCSSDSSGLLRMTGKADLPEKDEADDERFDRTLRNLLNTPPKPRKARADRPALPADAERIAREASAGFKRVQEE
jgi:hypothetical protein